MSNVSGYRAMNIELLAHQAWILLRKLDKIIEAYCIGSVAMSTQSLRKEKVYRTHTRAYTRFIRRMDRSGVNRKVLISVISGEKSSQS